MGAFDRAAHVTGGVVLLDDSLGRLPVLRGSNGEPVPLYKVVEVMDELLDFDELRAEFPTLSYTQLDACLTFIRALCQTNIHGIDVDAAMDDGELAPAEIDELRSSLLDRDQANVLDHD